MLTTNHGLCSICFRVGWLTETISGTGKGCRRLRVIFLLSWVMSSWPFRYFVHWSRLIQCMNFSSWIWSTFRHFVAKSTLVSDRETVTCMNFWMKISWTTNFLYLTGFSVCLRDVLSWIRSEKYGMFFCWMEWKKRFWWMWLSRLCAHSNKKFSDSTSTAMLMWWKFAGFSKKQKSMRSAKKKS